MKDIVNNRIVTYISIAVAFLSLLGYFYSAGVQLNSIQERLDRNCHFLATIQGDVRYIIIQHASNPSQASVFREIFDRTFNNICG